MDARGRGDAPREAGGGGVCSASCRRARGARSAAGQQGTVVREMRRSFSDSARPRCRVPPCALRAAHAPLSPPVTACPLCLRWSVVPAAAALLCSLLCSAAAAGASATPLPSAAARWIRRALLPSLDRSSTAPATSGRCCGAPQRRSTASAHSAAERSARSRRALSLASDAVRTGRRRTRRRSHATQCGQRGRPTRPTQLAAATHGAADTAP